MLVRASACSAIGTGRGLCTVSVTELFALAIALAGVPAVAAAASTAVGLDAQYGQIAFAVLVAALVVTGQSRLRPAVERVFFTQRYAVERGTETLLRDLSACTSPAELLATGDSVSTSSSSRTPS